MDQLIFIGVLVVFSILNEIAKKKKKEAEAALQGQEGYELTPEEQDWQWEPAGELRPGSGQAPVVAEASEASGRSSGAQGLIPRDVWEEIAALAGGRPLPQPAPEPPTPAPEPRAVEVEDRQREPVPARPDHAVHRSHAKYGTPVSERLRPLDTPDMHRAAGPSQEVRSVLSLLEGGGPSLRQAIILQELLGPPVALRDE